MRETGERSRTGVVPPEGLRPPQGLNAAMEGLAREVLLKTPTDIFAFAAEYFENLIRMREQFSFDGKPTDIQNLVSANLKNIENTGKIPNDKNSTLVNSKYKNQKQAKSFDNKSNIDLYLKRQNSNLKSKSLENSIFLINEKLDDPIKLETKHSSPKIEDDDDIKAAPLIISSGSEENITQDDSKTLLPASEAEDENKTKGEIILHGDVAQNENSDQNSLINVLTFDVNNISAIKDENTNLEDAVIHETVSFIEEESKQDESKTADVSENIDTQSKRDDQDFQVSSNVDTTPDEQNDVSNVENQKTILQKLIVDNTSSLIQDLPHAIETNEPGETSKNVDVQEETFIDSVIVNKLNDVDENLKEPIVDNNLLAKEESKPDETNKSIEDNNKIAENLQKNGDTIKETMIESNTDNIKVQDDRNQPTPNREFDSQNEENSTTKSEPDSEEILSNGNIKNLYDKINDSSVNINNLEESTTLMDDIISINNIDNFSTVEVMHVTAENNSSSRKKRSISISESDLESNIENVTSDKSEDMLEGSTIANIDTKEDDETLAMNGRNTTTGEKDLGEAGGETNITKENDENETSNLISDGKQNHDFESEDKETALQNNFSDTEKLDSDIDVRENNQDVQEKLSECNITDIESQEINTEDIIKAEDASIENTSTDEKNESLNDEATDEAKVIVSTNIVEEIQNSTIVDPKTETDLTAIEDLSNGSPQSLIGQQEDNVQKIENDNENAEMSRQDEEKEMMSEEEGVHEDDINHKDEKNLLIDEDNESSIEKHGENIQQKQEDSVENENSETTIQNDNEDSLLDDKGDSGNDKSELNDISDHSEKNINTLTEVGVEGNEEQIDKFDDHKPSEDLSINENNDASENCENNLKPEEDVDPIDAIITNNEDNSSINENIALKNEEPVSDVKIDEISENHSNDILVDDKNKTDGKHEIDFDNEQKDEDLIEKHDELTETQHSISEESDKFDKASVVIQRNYRGYQVRKNLKTASDGCSDEISKNLSNEAGEIEDTHKTDVVNEPKDAENIKETQNSINDESDQFEKASILIQKIFRGFQVRKNLKTASDGDSVEISKNLSNEAGEIEDTHKTDIENEPKDTENIKETKNSINDESDQFEKASVVIQRNYRGYQVRKSLKTASDGGSDEISKNLSNEASEIEDTHKTDIENEPKDAENIKETQNSINDESDQFEKASVVIQRNYRGYQVRKNLKTASDGGSDEISKNLSNEASEIEDTNKTDIENEPKDAENIKETQNSINDESDQFEKASVVIQRNYRGYQVRKSLKTASDGGSDEISKNLSNEAGEIEDTHKTDIENEPKDAENIKETQNSINDESDQFEKASVVIQRNYRGYQVRKNLKTASDGGSDEISKNISDDASEIEKKHENEPRENDDNIKDIKKSVNEESDTFEKASILIQKIFRGFQVRKNLKAASDGGSDEISKNISNEASEIEDTHETNIENELKDDNIKEIENSVNDENHNFEKASILIQKIFRGFQVRKNLPNPIKKQAESEDKNQEVANNEAVKDDSDILLGESNELANEEVNGDSKRADNLLRTLSYQAAMDNTLYTVSEERNSYSTDEESSTFSSAATKIQAGVRGYLTRKYLRNKTGTSSDTTAPSIGEDSRSLDEVGNAGESHVNTDNGVHQVMEAKSSILIDQADKHIPGINLIEANKESEESASRPNQNRKRLRREDAIQLQSPYSSGETPINKQTSKASEDEEQIGDLAQSIITEIESDTYTPVVEIKQTIRSPTVTPHNEPLTSEKRDNVKSDDTNDNVKMDKQRTFEITDKGDENKDEEMKNIQLTVENMNEIPELNLNFDDDGDNQTSFLSPDLEKIKKEKEDKDRKVLPRYSSEVETLVSKHPTENIDDVEDQLDEMPTPQDIRSDSSSDKEMLKQTTEGKVSDVTELKTAEVKDDLNTIKGILHSGEFHDTIVLPTKVDRKLSIQKGKSSST